MRTSAHLLCGINAMLVTFHCDSKKPPQDLMSENERDHGSRGQCTPLQEGKPMQAGSASLRNSDTIC